MIKRPFKLICFALLSVLFALGAVAAGAENAGPKELSYVIFLGEEDSSWDGSPGETPEDLICFFPIREGRRYGFVLPGAWDVSRLRIYLSGVESVRIGGRDYFSGDPISLTPDEAFSVKPRKGGAITLTVRRTGGLPVLFIRTESDTCDAIHADKTVREPGRLLMTDPEGRILHREPLRAVRARGNETFRYNKKPYQIKLEESRALIGDRRGKTWVLLANALDRSQIRNTLALDLARRAGAFAYTPAARSVDLYMNHDYKGTYLLTEKVEAAPDRVPVRDLEKLLQNMNPGLDFAGLEVLGENEYLPGARKYRELPALPEDLTGGYILYLNKTERYATEACGFVTDRGCPVALQEPKYVSAAQIEYLAGLFQQLENALFSEDGTDPVSGRRYSELLDFPSFVDRYVLAEVLDDFDGPYTYFYKDVDSVDPKLYVGPVWDQDNILGVCVPQSDPEAIHLSRTPEWEWSWFAAAAKQADFSAAASEAYRGVFRPALQVLLGREEDPEGVLRSVDDYADEVRASAQMDFFRWKNPLLPKYHYYNADSGDSFEAQIAYLKNYLTVRLDALDAFF